MLFCSRVESWRGFFKGLSPYLLHVTPNICIVFLVYEKVTHAVAMKRKLKEDEMEAKLQAESFRQEIKLNETEER